jgi:hypothetical protein
MLDMLLICQGLLKPSLPGSPAVQRTHPLCKFHRQGSVLKLQHLVAKISTVIVIMHRFEAVAATS